MCRGLAHWRGQRAHPRRRKRRWQSVYSPVEGQRPTDSSGLPGPEGYKMRRDRDVGADFEISFTADLFREKRPRYRIAIHRENNWSRRSCRVFRAGGVGCQGWINEGVWGARKLCFRRFFESYMQFVFELFTCEFALKCTLKINYLDNTMSSFVLLHSRVVILSFFSVYVANLSVVWRVFKYNYIAKRLGIFSIHCVTVYFNIEVSMEVRVVVIVHEFLYIVCLLR